MKLALAYAAFYTRTGDHDRARAMLRVAESFRRDSIRRRP